MDPERWARIESLYHAALAKAPGEREDYLAAACPRESDVWREVVSLLACADSGPGTVGKRVGSYEILGLLGAGGMGEVYRARDTRLKREVALKMLPEALANDPARMARFQREAELLASINHPNIAQVYGLEDRAIVMELVEGETLASPLPVDTALNYARQIAEALEYAHEKGIIHRDLKPANIKATPEGVVKVLDFGLAKAIEGQAGASGNPSESPTLTAATEVGAILGTAAYMSPEQATGKTADRRSDIWSFGVVLFEMLTGKSAFEGDSISETLASVLKMEPDWNALPVATPASIRNLVRRCLTKDRKQRLQAIGEARIALENPATEETAQAVDPKLRWATGTAALLFVIAAWLAIIHFTGKRPAAELMRFEIPDPGSARGNGRPILSPDGRMIAFGASDSAGRGMLWIRSLNSLDVRPLPGTENAGDSFWSPDSRFLAFVDGDKLKKVALSGGPPETLCEVSGSWRGGAWSRDGIVIFGSAGHGLMQVSDSGGAASPLTVLDQSRHERFHALPSFLPDGRHFCYSRYGDAAENQGFFTGSLDAKPEQQSSARLASWVQGFCVQSAGSETGYVLFRRESALMAQRFDNRRLRVAGQPVLIAGDLRASLGGAPVYSASETGVVAYSRLFAASQLIWFDRDGKKFGTVGEPAQHAGVALSADGTRVAVSHAEGSNGGGNLDIWIYEFARGTIERLTSDSSQNSTPVWSPDGTRIAFSGGHNLIEKASNGLGKGDVLFTSSLGNTSANDWSSDGRFLLFGTGFALWYLPLTGDDRKPRNYFQAEFRPMEGQFSPDGHYVAYTCAETGRNEIYVRPFPNASGGRWLISTNGGTQPRWRGDGRELFYISGDSKLMSVGITTTPAFEKVGSPRALFSAPVPANGTGAFSYDVTRDGGRFLIDAAEITSATRPAPITVVLNWPALMEK
jgi:eukaryotic-like serine/threonine-protein kinase